MNHCRGRIFKRAGNRGKEDASRWKKIRARTGRGRRRDRRADGRATTAYTSARRSSAFQFARPRQDFHAAPWTSCTSEHAASLQYSRAREKVACLQWNPIRWIWDCHEVVSSTCSSKLNDGRTSRKPRAFPPSTNYTCSCL